MNYELPKPLGPDGEPLSQEQIEKLNEEPLMVPVELTENSITRTFFIAADFDQCGREEKKVYDKWKARYYGVIQDERPVHRKGKAADKGAEADSEERTLSGSQIEKLAELNDELNTIGTNLIFPAVLGGNVPGMPQPADSEGKRKLRIWLEGGTPRGRAALEGLLSAFDPTGHLAQEKLAAKKQAEMSEMMEKQLMGRMSSFLEQVGPEPKPQENPEVKAPAKPASDATESP
jgi:hypothetical protein